MFDVLKIKSPEFIKNLSYEELEILAGDIRSFIIKTLSETGGHLSSNLGVVDATIAMHYVFCDPADKILFDTGHQAYTHKILTGRAESFFKLRKAGGISGFPSFKESPYDIMESGHASTSLSFASGLAAAEPKGNIVCFIGDGAMQGGLALAGLNYIGCEKPQKVIIVLNDNEMSISKCIGRMALNMQNKRCKKSHEKIKKVIPHAIYKLNRSLLDSVKTFLYGNDIFTTLGYRYYGPIDGHDFKQMIKYFKIAKECPKSVVIHLKTVKGKGYFLAEGDMQGAWHGTEPFVIKTGQKKTLIPKGFVPWGRGMSRILDDLLNTDKDITIINPGMLVGTYMTCLKEKYPDNVFDVGINEEHAVVMASAMAKAGLKVIVAMYATFMQRAYDQIINDVCRASLPVVFLTDHCGFVNDDGSTHQGIYMPSVLLTIPGLTVAFPSSLSHAKGMLELALKIKKPFAICYSKFSVKDEITSVPVNLGKWEYQDLGKKINIVAYGDYISEINGKYRDILRKKQIGLINALFLKPVDIELLKQVAGCRLVVIEDAECECCLATEIMRCNFKFNLNLEIKSYAVEGIYPDLGTREELREDAGLSLALILNDADKE